MFVAAVAGITEPLDFSFLFASPLLWLVHSLLTAVSETILWGIGARTYMLYGLIDTVVSNSVFSPSVTKFYLVIIVGIIMSVVWYFVFVLLIKKLNIQTPGREADLSEAAVVVDGSEGEQTLSSSDDFEDVVAGLGGRENIESISNCFTRLRVTVKDEALVDSSRLEQISQQKGIVLNGTNVQVIIGMGVQSFKEDICERLGMNES
jgi:PTS system arbutin-like IIC component